MTTTLKRAAEMLRHMSDAGSTDEYRDCNAIAAELEAMGEQEPVAIVRMHLTGGNVGISWSARPTETAPAMKGGEKLFLYPPMTNSEMAFLATSDRFLAACEEVAQGYSTRGSEMARLAITRYKDMLAAAPKEPK